jgi:NADH dehydrogenase
MMPALSVMEALAPHPPATRDQLKMLQIDNTTTLDSVKTAFGFEPRTVAGNIGYISKMSLGDALRITLGFMPRHIRDH